MNHPQRPYLLFALIAVLLGACAPAGSGLSQVATMVADTLAAQGGPTATEPMDAAQDPFGACANSGQLSLAYVKDSNIWLWVDGVKTQLTNSGDVNDIRISDDGCRIAYARAMPNPAYDPNVDIPTDPTLSELWAVSSDGSGNQKLAGLEFFDTLPQPEGNPGLGLYKFEWQPGSHTLAFSTEVLGFGLNPSNDIHLVDADSSTIMIVLPPGQGGDFYFSHDGQIAFSTPTTVNVVNTDGTNLRPAILTFPAVITYSEFAYYPPLNWNTVDTDLFVAIPPEDGLAITDEVAPLGTSLWAVPADGESPVNIGNVLVVWLAIDEADYSPDRSHIAFLRPVGDGINTSQRELVVALSDGSDETAALLLPEVGFEAWSPDGSQYIYSYRDPAFRLFLGSPTSPNVAPISVLTPFEAGAAEIVWVEENTFVILLQGDSGAELSVMETSGAGQVVETFIDFSVPFDVAH